MKVHHINGLTMCPRAGRLLNGTGRIVAHCLVVETGAGLVVVDTGLGVAALEKRQQLPAMFRHVVRPRLDPAETVLRQIEALGFSRADVRHIVMTHLDLDHAGGLADFPEATVHVFDDELTAALAPPTRFERERYFALHWGHGPRWSRARVDGERWFGFDAVRSLPGLPPEILLIPLTGHTRGHSGVAIEQGDRWLLHCGDAYFYRGELDVAAPHCTVGFRVVERVVAAQNPARLANRDRLLALKRAHPEFTLFSAHDPDEMAALVTTPVTTPPPS